MPINLDIQKIRDATNKVKEERLHSEQMKLKRKLLAATYEMERNIEAYVISASGETSSETSAALGGGSNCCEVAIPSVLVGSPQLENIKNELLQKGFSVSERVERSIVYLQISW
jgi:hypothetical protein